MRLNGTSFQRSIIARRPLVDSNCAWRGSSRMRAIAFDSPAGPNS